MKALYLKHNPAVLAARRGLEYSVWKLAGRGPAPHIYKQQVIRRIAKIFGLEVLVETGTYLGEMVSAMAKNFSIIYSVELAHEFFTAAEKKFASQKHITIVEGDSAEVLPGIIKNINAPVLFWLDGHYSGGRTAKGAQQTPIAKELLSIFSLCGQRFAILIDDARLFTGTNDYPALADLTALVLKQRPDLKLEVENDIIRIYPKN